jgi:hypothetical protein
MSSRAAAALALLALALAGHGLRASGAALTARADSPQTVTAQSVASWLSQYSQATDPDGLTGYAAGGSSADATLTYQTTLSLTEILFGATRNRAWTVKAPASFPEGVTSVTVTLTVLEDPAGATGLGARLNTVGSTGGSTSLTLTAGAKRQINLSTPILNGLLPTGRTYTPRVLVTVTFAGNAGAFLRYSVPVAIRL